MTRSKLSAATLSTLAVLALALAAAPEADAGWFSCHRARRRCVPQACQQARYAAPAPSLASRSLPPPPRAYMAPQGGPGAHEDFLAWLNAARIRHGLRPVAWDAGLAADAAANSARGFGHSFMGRARRQNAGVGGLGAISVAWMASPGHASAILDPTVTRFGLAYVGGVWTLSLN